MSFDMGKRKIKLVVTTTGSRWFYSVSKLDAGVFFLFPMKLFHGQRPVIANDSDKYYLIERTHSCH